MKRGKNSRSNPSRSGNRRELGFSLRSLVLVFTPLLVVGCGGSEANIAASAAYSEPGWMAEVRSQNEEHTLAGIACLQAEGLNADSQSGMVTLQVDDELFPPGFVDQAWQKCLEEGSPPDYAASATPESEYERMLDVRVCLIDQGYAIPEPPSREVWIEDYRTLAPWDPYEVFSGALHPQMYSVSLEEMKRLQAICTPSMVGSTAVFDID